MPKEIEVSTATSITKRWTIINYSVVPPILPPPTDGSLAVNFVIETLVNGEVKSRESVGHGVSGPAFYELLADVGVRLEAALKSGATASDAYYAATRDALYARLVTDGVMPAGTTDAATVVAKL